MPILLEGPRLLREAEISKINLVTTIFSESFFKQQEFDVSSKASSLESIGVRIVKVPDTIMKFMSPADSPSGVITIADQPNSVTDPFCCQPPSLTLLADNISDPGNMGALIRAAEAGGATGLICCGPCADPFGWKALRGAMGSTFRLPLSSEHDLSAAVSKAQTHGVRILAMTPKGRDSLHTIDLTKSTAIVLGSEATGLKSETIALTDTTVSIPMNNEVESLNVAVAGALVVYEARRQRTNGGDNS